MMVEITTKFKLILNLTNNTFAIVKFFAFILNNILGRTWS
jgi:hypothetical protein